MTRLSPRPLLIVALACACALAPLAAAQEGDRATATSATPEWVAPVAEPGYLRITVDASAAINALVHWKIREGHLQVRLDGAMVVDRTERKPPKSLLVYADQLAAGEHVIEVRWDVTFRSATDRHHPHGAGPREMGFGVPALGFAQAIVTVQPHGQAEVTARLQRRSAGGLQGDTWVEWDGVDDGELEPPADPP